MLSTSASHYLVPPPEYFWRWDVEDHAAAWDDGSTLAFARELIPLLGELSVDIGLPPLGSILLILHGAKHPDQFEQKWMILDRFARSLGINDTPPMGVARLQETSRRGLLLVGQLPDDLRNTQSARLLLLRTLFLPTPNRLPVDRSVEIVAEFRAASASQLNGEQDLKGMTRILRDLNALHVAFQNWSQESLESALRTGGQKRNTRRPPHRRRYRDPRDGRSLDRSRAIERRGDVSGRFPGETASSCDPDSAAPSPSR
jgi:hypothetical protein